MKKTLIVVGIILAVLFIIYRIFAGTYNTLVERDELVKKHWSDVNTVYQERMNLIENLVETIKGSSEFEQSTLVGVVEARAKATSVNISADNLNEENMKKFQQAQSGYSSALSRLLVAVEQYPQLKTTEQYALFMAQQEGIENRLRVETRKYNGAVQEYNTFLRQFPNNIIAGMYNFTVKPTFAAEEGADKKVKVDFSKK
jgi:LemA protein